MLRQQAPRRERVCPRPITAQLGGEGLVPGARWLGSRLCKPCDSQRWRVMLVHLGPVAAQLVVEQGPSPARDGSKPGFSNPVTADADSRC